MSPISIRWSVFDTVNESGRCFNMDKYRKVMKPKETLAASIPWMINVPLCRYIYIYICIYICIYVCIYIERETIAVIYIYIYILLFIYLYIYILLYIYATIYLYIYTHIHYYIYMCLIYIHIYIYYFKTLSYTYIIKHICLYICFVMLC